ncbi:MAG: hypothetical protein WB919_19290 [Candidatus Sulfotelmatobacter sp.]
MAYESELEAELEDEFESELEDESEDELEGEDFLGGLLGKGEDFLGGILGEGEDFLGDILGEGEGEDFMGSILGEGEGELEDEYEDEISPIRKIYPDAVMEHLGELAAESESEDEAAEHFLPLIGMAASKLLPVVAKAVAPMAKRALPKIARILTRATPKLTRGIGTVAKALHRHPQTRHLLKVVPGIARRTVGKLAHTAARGGHITPRTAVRTLAKQTRRVLGSPQQRTQALRRHNHLERKLHGRTGRGITHPHMRHGSYRGRGWGYRGGAAPRMGSGVYRPGLAARAVGGRPLRYGRTAGGRAAGGHGGCCCGCCGR